MKKNDLFTAGLVPLFFLIIISYSAHAQTYPNQPIRMVITQAPGDAADIMCRAIGTELAKILGTPVIPLNKVGGGGTVGSDFVAKGKKDGYTILFTSSNIFYAHAMNPEEIPFNPLQDLEPLCSATSVPLVTTVKADSPWRSFQELVDYMKQNPGKIRGGTVGVGTVGHFNLEIIHLETGREVTMVPFKGGSPLLTALLGGHIEMADLAMGMISSHINTGTLRGLLTSKKIPEFPNIPTLTQLGYKRDKFSFWTAFFLPVGVPESIKKILSAGLEKAIKSEDSVSVFHKTGALEDYKPQDVIKKVIDEEYGMAKHFFKNKGQGPK